MNPEPATSLPPDVVLSVRNVSKKFCRNLKRSMRYGFRDLGRNLIGVRQAPDTLRDDEFWAVQDVSFDLKRGQCLGLIGANGSGKSTLLRVLHGIFPPDRGEVLVRGRVEAMIALGVGFHAHLTGRENIYLKGSILGMTRAEIQAKMDRIISFAEIGAFIDAPVATYSSGMTVRLGFAIAASTDPDLLVVDEVLAVGDMSFQERCMRKMDEIRTSGSTVVLVTHSLYRIESLCDRAIWIEDGSVTDDGPAASVVRNYLDSQEKHLVAKARADRAAVGGGTPFDEHERSPVTIDRVEVVDAKGEACTDIPFGVPVGVRIAYTAHRRIERPLFNFRILREGRGIMEAGMLIDGHGPEAVEGPGVVECHFASLPLTPKVYDILVYVRAAEGIADIAPMRVYATFRVTDQNLDSVPMEGPMALNLLRQGSPVYVPRAWRFEADCANGCGPGEARASVTGGDQAVPC